VQRRAEPRAFARRDRRDVRGKLRRAALIATLAPIATTGWLTRAARFTRLCLHLVYGLLQLLFIYRRRTRAGQLDMIRVWSAQLLAILGMTTRVHYAAGTPPSPCITVANHISWLDIFVINAHHPARFVAKAEIRGWPLVGALCRRTGTLFIERVKRRDAHRIKDMIAAALADGDQVAVFPESTTTEGDVLRHFHANLLQAAVDGNVPLQPVTLQYFGGDGARSKVPAYVDEMTLIESLSAILARPSLSAEVVFLAAIAPDGRSRRELAQAAETAIAAALDLPVVNTPAAWAAGRQA
jgi:1-acyl-sn-glycerol-3-phosphate acyltransferase